MKASRARSSELDEELMELEHNLKRLRTEYERYFAGQRKREPQDVLGKVQRSLTRLVNNPPRNVGQKFRFNQLNAKFHSYRQLWGRLIRQMEAGTYKRDVFKAKLHSNEPADPTPEPEKKRRGLADPSSGIKKLFSALSKARKKTGQAVDDLSEEKLATIVRDQTEALQSQHGEGKVRFRVVIEDDKAKLKASFKKG